MRVARHNPEMGGRWALPVQSAKPAVAAGWALALGLALLLAAAPAALRAEALVVYDDALQNGFDDWSWAVHSLAETGTVHAGSRAISFEPDDWEGLYLHRDAGIDLASYEAAEFWIHGGAAGGQAVRFVLLIGGQAAGSAPVDDFTPGGAIPAGEWVLVRVPFADLGVVSGVLSGFWFQGDVSADQGVVYLDDMVLAERTGEPPPPQELAVGVDLGANRRPVNPMIYGFNFGTAAQLADLGVPFRRWGGNSTTRYSW